MKRLLMLVPLTVRWTLRDINACLSACHGTRERARISYPLAP